MPLAPRRAFAHAAFAAAALAVTAAAAVAQAPVNPFGFGVSAGAAVPAGDFADRVNTGYSVDGLITLRVPTLPVSFRGEVGYSRFGNKGRNDANLRVISGVANVVLAFQAAPTAVVRPYLIGGVGIEIPLSGITGFGEVRYTSIFTEGTNTNFVPIRFGIRF